jgi:hypothetical protein
VPRERLSRDAGDADTAHARWRAGEVTSDHMIGDADGLEQPGTAIRAECGHAHLCQDLPQALEQRGLIVRVQRLDVGRFGVPGLRDGECDGGISHARTYGIRAEAEERGKRVLVSRVARVHDDARAQAQASADEVLMHRGGSEQRWQCGVGGVDVVITQDEARCALANRLVARSHDRIECGREALGVSGCVEQQAQLVRTPAILLHADKRMDVAVRQHRMIEVHMRALRAASRSEDW